MKQKKEIRVFNQSIVGIPCRPKEFLEYWQEKIALIPEEFQKYGVVDLEAGGEYDRPCIDLEIIYTRPETDKEEQMRERERENTENEIRRRDMAELNRIKRKYHL